MTQSFIGSLPRSFHAGAKITRTRQAARRSTRVTQKRQTDVQSQHWKNVRNRHPNQTATYLRPVTPMKLSKVPGGWELKKGNRKYFFDTKREAIAVMDAYERKLKHPVTTVTAYDTYTRFRVF